MTHKLRDSCPGKGNRHRHTYNTHDTHYKSVQLILYIVRFIDVPATPSQDHQAFYTKLEVGGGNAIFHHHNIRKFVFVCVCYQRAYT